jgi:hypothetical protein
MSAMHSNAVPTASSAFDIDAVRSHVRMLHDRAKGSVGVFVVSVFNEGKEGIVTKHRVGDVEAMVSSIMSHAETTGANVYTGLQLFRPDLRRGSRGKESDIVAVLGLVADIDSDTGKSGAMPVDASYVVETSPGNSQPVILFDKPITSVAAKPLAKALQAATGADSGTGDITHVWRIPGTLNYPNAAKIARGRASEPAHVRFIEPFAGEVYAPETLTEVLAPFSKPDIAAADADTFTSEVDTMPLLKRLSDIARKKLQGDGQPDRSAHAARVVEQIGYEGFNLNEAVSLCRHHAGAWAERYKDNDERLVKDVERLWSKHVAPAQIESAENAAAVEKLLQPANDNHTRGSLPVIDPRDWQGKPVPDRQWFVEGWIPHRTVTNLSGRWRLR